MQKLIILTISVLLIGSMAACGDSPAASSSGQASSPASAAVSISSSAISDAPVSVSSTSGEYYFKDSTLKIHDATIKITDHKIIPAGEVGNEYGENAVIAFWYSVTNDSEDFIDATTAWIACFEAVQDNDPNIVNELEIGGLPDSKFLDTQMADIKPGGTLENAVAYELTDLETPVELFATQGMLGDKLGSQIFEIAGK